MKNRFFLGMCATLAIVSAPLNAALDCKHGFWIFGQDHIYISHKPEIGSPCHGYQVILEVALEGDALDTYRDLEAKKGEMTLEFPHHFLLEELKVGQLAPVKATLHDGNYEDQTRPHQAAAKEVPVRVVRQVLFRKLSEDGQGTVQTFLFGTPGEVYLANRVDQKPDFDQLVQVDIELPPEPEARAYSVAGHTYAAGKKQAAFLKEGESGELMDGSKRFPFEVKRKLELTMSDDAFAASH